MEQTYHKLFKSMMDQVERNVKNQAAAQSICTPDVEAAVVGIVTLGSKVRDEMERQGFSVHVAQQVAGDAIKQSLAIGMGK